MSDKAPVKLRIPRQDLEAFSRFTLSQTGAAEWAAALPVTNAREVALALVQTLGELNRVALPAADIAELLVESAPT
ncbi:MAG: hypothetical protein NWS56_07375 [Haliea sp.]|nr:hypothetical protein [Haliea sp.]